MEPVASLIPKSGFLGDRVVSGLLLPLGRIELSAYNVAVASLLSVLTVAIWRRYFSSLSDIPGPFLASITRLWHIKVIIAGNQNIVSSKLHERYGHFFRMAPNEVSIMHPEAVKKILLQPIKKVSC